MTEQAREFKAAERKKAAAKGQARSDGSFPIKTVADLQNAIKALGRAKNKASAKAHIIARAKALKATHRLPKEWNVSGSSDKAHAGLIECPECDRAFLNEYLLQDHAEAVHTFDDIRQMVSEEVREQYNKPGNYSVTPPVPSVYAWVCDLSTDWVVFSVEGEECELYKASYSLVDGIVTLGTPVEVVRRTVYEPAPVEPDDNDDKELTSNG